jgi:hypothetical protein
MVYFFTPILQFTPLNEDGTPNESLTTQFSPGYYDTDDSTILKAATYADTFSPKCDKIGGRFVLVCPDGTTALNGWEPKTAAEVNDVYPGLVPGGGE